MMNDDRQLDINKQTFFLALILVIRLQKPKRGIAAVIEAAAG
jgi:hypothetical protein